MSRLIRNTAILAKIETTYGTDSVPAGATNAMLVSNLSINPLNAQNVSRDNIRPYLGGSEELLGTAYVDCSFDVELVGAGAAGIAPAWGPLLRACAFAETVTATTRVDYTPISTAIESVSIYWHDDGVLHKLLGARGNAMVKLGVSQRPVLSFTFQGIVGAVSAVSNPTVTLTAFKTPQVVTDANTGDVTWGATHSASGAPALTGGTVYPSQGFELNLGNSVQFTPLLGGETVDITQRDVSGTIRMDLTAAQEVAFFDTVRLATLASMGMVHGTVTGNKVLVFAPSVQVTNPSKQEVNGKRLIGYDMRLVPNPAGSGNDELRIVASF